MTSSFFPSESVSDASRYELGRLLGSGNAGAVYLAHDRETGEQVAFKKLLHIDPKAVLRLKREFRSLANMHHPNLVKLYDLGRSIEGWFLTMEYVEGPDLLRYLDVLGDPGATVQNLSTTPPVDRVLAAFHQLACGVHALHQAKVLHRDLKPSNVLVAQGRVVVLDFGLARELDSHDRLVTQDGMISGTPAYMPPEQATGEKLAEVSDWYAVGVMLYQALSGRLPIDGRNASDLLQRKLAQDPLPLERLGVRVPPAVSALCMRLLAREIDDRPQGEEVLAALSQREPTSLLLDLRDTRDVYTEQALRTESQPRASGQPLFGRDRELAKLHDAFERVRQGEPVVMHVRGASGAGKTALVEHFLEQVAAAHSGGLRERTALVLRSRCYEREAMPFKALDGLIDALVRHLSQLDDFDVAHLLPADVAELSQLFPALDRLRAVQRLSATARPRGDGVVARQRAELALRELFVRLAARQPVVIWIDDLQWGDLDSASLLESWLPHMSKAPILMVFSYRSEELHTSSCLRVLLGSAGARAGLRTYQRTLEIAPLRDEDVARLCEHRLAVHGEAQPGLVSRIVLESRGSPFLASQLTALAQARLERPEAQRGGLSMEELVVQSMALVPPDARALLQVLAIAGRPVPTQTALRAAGIKQGGNAHLHSLKTLRLIRSREVAGERRLEVYHDRVREGVHAALPTEERKRIYDRLLRELEVSGTLDADWLHTLALGAGQPAPALRYGLHAAERASGALAFERAAELYQICLELTDPAAVSSELWGKLGLALARCRRGVKAADAYLESAKLMAAEQRWPVLRLAASHLLRSGQFDRGEVIVDEILAAQGESVPKSERGLMLAVGWARARLALRGDRHQPRTAAEVPTELRQQVDLFATLTVDTTSYDPLRAALFEARCLRAALTAGDPESIVRAFCISASLGCVSGSPRAAARCETLLSQAESAYRSAGRERLGRYVCAARAICAYLLGRPLQVLAPAQEAERLYREDTRGDEQAEYYHLFTVQTVRIGALVALGDHPLFFSELDGCLERARATDNQSMLLHLALFQTIAEQLRGEPAVSRARLQLQAALLPKQRFGVLHVMHMCAVMSAASASGDYAWSRPTLERFWPEYLQSVVKRSAYMAVSVYFAHARWLLSQWVDDPSSRAESPASLVAADIKALEKCALQPLARGHAETVLARVAILHDRRDEATTRLRDAAEALEAAEHRPAAHIARFGLGL
ncbi:MAG: protein kinase, partial [Polyangiales bacterium]